MSELLVCEKSKEFKEFCEKTKEMPFTNKQDLRSLLITPIQRIPRYKLLLQDLISKTDEEHVDMDGLKNALEEMSSIANQINEAVRNAENMQKMMQVQQSFITAIDVRRFVLFLEKAHILLAKLKNIVGRGSQKICERRSFDKDMQESKEGEDVLAFQRHPRLWISHEWNRSSQNEQICHL